MPKFADKIRGAVVPEVVREVADHLVLKDAVREDAIEKAFASGALPKDAGEALSCLERAGAVTASQVYLLQTSFADAQRARMQAMLSKAIAAGLIAESAREYGMTEFEGAILRETPIEFLVSRGAVTAAQAQTLAASLAGAGSRKVGVGRVFAFNKRTMGVGLAVALVAVAVYFVRDARRHPSWVVGTWSCAQQTTGSAPGTSRYLANGDTLDSAGLHRDVWHYERENDDEFLVYRSTFEPGERRHQIDERTETSFTSHLEGIRRWPGFSRVCTKVSDDPLFEGVWEGRAISRD